MSDNEVKDNFQILSFDLRVAFRALEVEKAALQARVAELEEAVTSAHQSLRALTHAGNYLARQTLEKALPQLSEEEGAE